MHKAQDPAPKRLVNPLLAFPAPTARHRSPEQRELGCQWVIRRLRAGSSSVGAKAIRKADGPEASARDKARLDAQEVVALSGCPGA